MKTTRMWLKWFGAASLSAIGAVSHAQQAAETVPTEAWSAAPISEAAPTTVADAIPLEATAATPDDRMPGEGIRLDEAITPIASYFQSAASGAPGGKPKYPLITISGAAQIDAVWFAQDDANQAVVGDAQDFAGFRRSRLGALGNLADNVSYKMEYDFGSPGRPNFTDVWVSTSDLPVVGNVKIGQWKQPFSMEPATSFRELMFMERSLAFALVPFRQTGIGAFNTAFDESATWAISGYRFQTDSFGNDSGDSGYGMATRQTLLLFENEYADTIHIGGGYTINNPSTNQLRIRSAPEVGFTQQDFRNTTDFPAPFFVDSGVLPTDTYQVVGAELAGGFGSLLFQSEIMVARVDQEVGPSLDFPAGYAQMGYVLTGERRAYNKQAGAYGRVVPDVNFGKGGPGAIEVAGRYSVLDLNDANIPGGRVQDLTAGINWYLNRYTRVEFNYIHPILDRPVGNYTEADIFGTRAQFDF